jgi:hypothetical protein
MAQTIQELDGLRTDTVDPKYHVFIVLHGRDSGLGNAVGGEETPRLSSGGQAEKPCIEPWLGVVERLSKIAHGAGVFTGTYETPVAKGRQMIQPRLGVSIEFSPDEP